MVKTQTLSDFNSHKNALLVVANRKVLAAKTNPLNENLDAKYKVEINAITDLLNAIDAKFKKCEILYHTYFENIDHAVLSGNVSSLPFEMDCNFVDGVATLRNLFRVDDKLLYKEIIDHNFQSFILLIASLYENLVLLAEIFIKKVIVHLKDKGPISSPLHDYVSYLKLLISLGYRPNDKLNRCMNSSDAFFQKYLKQINLLRNKFIHGYSINLKSDGYNYFVKNVDTQTFTVSSPDLIIDTFTKEVLDNTRKFVTELLIALKESTKHYKKSIPA